MFDPTPSSSSPPRRIPLGRRAIWAVVRLGSSRGSPNEYLTDLGGWSPSWRQARLWVDGDEARRVADATGRPRLYVVPVIELK